MKKHFLIYALFDPRTEEIRYVGQSTRGISRAKAHRWISPTQPHLSNWIRKLKSEGVEYGIKILEDCNSQDEVNDAEIKWIANMREAGCDLMNIASGGLGMSGYRHTEATKEKIRAKALVDGRKGRKQNHPSPNLNISEALRKSEKVKINLEKAHAARRGVRSSDLCVEKFTEFVRKPRSEKHKNSISKALKGKQKSPEAIRNSVEAKKKNRLTREN